MSKQNVAKTEMMKPPAPVQMGVGQVPSIEQRKLMFELAEVELEDEQLKVLLNTLVKVEDDRKCFKKIGGTLVEKKVKDIRPIFEERRKELAILITKIKSDLSENDKKFKVTTVKTSS